jgi:putative hydrolase
VSASGPVGDDNPFSGIPFLNEIMSMLSSQGGLNWDATRQLAFSLASGGESEPNVDPTARIAMEQLGRVAELHVAEATGLPGQFRATPVTRTEWARRSLDDYRPLFEALTTALAAPTETSTEEEDPVMGPLMAALSPMMLSFTAGGMIGHLAQHSLGTYDLPVPRRDTKDTMIVLANIDSFGEEWSLPSDDLRMWVALHEASHHFVLSVPHVAERLTELLMAFASNFAPNPHAIEEHLGGLDLGADPNELANISETFSNPEVLLGAVTNEKQREIQAQLSAVVAAVVGYVDHQMDRIGETLIGSYGQITEALRRRRVEADASDRFVERLLGLELSQDSYDRAGAFVSGVVERADEEGLTRLFSAPNHLPTPPEIDAPGLWLARIEFED